MSFIYEQNSAVGGDLPFQSLMFPPQGSDLGGEQKSWVPTFGLNWQYSYLLYV